MKYSTPINLHAKGITELLHSGGLRLQSGQYVQLGKLELGADGKPLYSVFDYAEKHYIRAYHGATTKAARAKYDSSKRSTRAFVALRAGEISLKEFHKTVGIT